MKHSVAKKRTWLIVALVLILAIFVVGVRSCSRLMKVHALEEAGYGNRILHQRHSWARFLPWEKLPGWTVMYRDPTYLVFRGDEPDDLIEGIKNLEGVRTLYLTSSFNDRQMSLLGGLSELEELLLIRSQVTNAGLQYLTGMPNLRSLRLDGLVAVDDNALISIKSHPNLEWVNLSGTSVTARGLAKLKSSRPNLAVTKPLSPSGSEE